MRILWIPHAGWQVPQRAHLFCRELSKTHEVHVTDIQASFSKPLDYLTRKYIDNFRYRYRLQDGVHVHGLPRFSPALHSRSLRQLNNKLAAKTVAKIIASNQIEVVVGSFVCPPPKAPRLVLDVFDDNGAYWRVYRGRPDYAAEIEQIERNYLDVADHVVTVSSVLQESVCKRMKASHEVQVSVIPNAVDVARYAAADGSEVRRRYDLEDRKVIGLISALGEFVGLLRLIEAYERLQEPNVALLIVGDGPALKPAMEYAEKRKLRNVIFTGRVPFSQVHQYFSAIDVGVVPFDKNAFTDAASPIKLLEYSAAQKTVVSTDLAEVQQMGFPNVVLVQPNSTSLAEGISTALWQKHVPPKDLAKYDIRSAVMSFEKILRG